VKLYQPVARGEGCLGNSAIRYSRLVYRTRAEAEDALDEFVELCLTRLHDHDMGYLLNVTSYNVIELEVV